MPIRDLLAYVVAGAMLCFSAVAVAEDLWSLYGPGCNANGIPEKTCLCSMDQVSKVHGRQAARYVGLEMVMRENEAAAIRDAIGEDKAFAASSLFDTAQNTGCSSASLEGNYAGSSSGAATMSGAAQASDAASQ